MYLESERHMIAGSKRCGLCQDEMTFAFLAIVELVPGVSLEEAKRQALRVAWGEHVRAYHSDKVLPPSLLDLSGQEFIFGLN